MSSVRGAPAVTWLVVVMARVSNEPDRPANWGRALALIAIFVVVVALTTAGGWLIENWPRPSDPQPPLGDPSEPDEEGS